MERVNYVNFACFSQSVLKLKNPTRPDGIDKDYIQQHILPTIFQSLSQEFGVKSSVQHNSL